MTFYSLLLFNLKIKRRGGRSRNELIRLVNFGLSSLGGQIVPSHCIVGVAWAHLYKPRTHRVSCSFLSISV